ncbi:hypothetical protein Tco_0710693 [Tanacetum coccineum]
MSSNIPPLESYLSSHKDASVEDVMNLLRLEGPLTDAPGMSDLQPDVEQLRVPLHRSEDQVVLGETSLSFSLSVSHSRMERIRENIAAQQLALIGVWNPLSEPLSVQNLTGTTSISDSVSVSAATTTTLSTTFAFTSSIPLYTIKRTRRVARTQMVRRVVRKRFREMLKGMQPLLPKLYLKKKSWTLLWNVSWSNLCVYDFGVEYFPSLLCSLLPGLLLALFYLPEVIKVGIPISTGITASVPYVSENGVSLLLDLIIVRCAQKT